jgi:UDP-glucose 4-epimerase
MHVLVTGGAGFIGGVTSEMLLSAGHSVTVLDDLSTGDRRNLDGRATRCIGDVGDVALLDELFAEGSIDAVIHFAGLIAAGDSMRAPSQYLEVNTGRSLTLFAAMARHGVRKVVFSSSAGVYGEPHFTPMTEAHPTVPTSVYGLSKLLVEQALVAIAAQGQLDFVALRYFNAAGGTGGHVECHQPESHLIPLALAAAAGHGPALSIFGTDYPTPDGTCIRDYIHVHDLARAHLSAINALDRGTSALICNLGTGQGYSVSEVISTIEQVTGLRVPTTVAPRRPGDPAELVAASDLARDVLGWVPERSSLERLISDAWEGFQTLHG